MARAQATIALVCDCDDTLAPDTTEQLLNAFRIDVPTFYEERVNPLVDAGYDPAVAYMTAIIRLVQEGPLRELTRDKMRAIGRDLAMFKGVPEVFRELEAEVRDGYGQYGITLEEYIITGGIAELIGASALSGVVDDLWGCDFDYDADGRVAYVRNVVSFTEKTRFLFNIQKGLVGPKYKAQPYVVNAWMDDDERPVPFTNMIYMGDGASDIPCMSLVSKGGGRAIAVLTRGKPYKTWAMSYGGRRADATIPPDYRKDGEYGYELLREYVMRIAERIKEGFAPKGLHFPSF